MNAYSYSNIHGLEWRKYLHDDLAQPRLRKNFRGRSMSASPFRVTTPQSCTASASGNANSPMKVGEMVGEAVFFLGDSVG